MYRSLLKPISILSLLAGTFHCTRPSGERPPAEPAQDALASLLIAGRIVPRSEFVLSFAIEGVITGYSLDQIDRFGKGEVLAALDAEFLRLELEGVEKELRFAEQNLQMAERKWSRAQLLHQSKAIAAESFESSTTELARIKHEKAMLEVKEKVIARKIRESSLVSPDEIAIIENHKHLGDHVGPGEALARAYVKDEVLVEFKGSADSLSLLKTGCRLAATVPDVNASFEVEISRILPVISDGQATFFGSFLTPPEALPLYASVEAVFIDASAP